MDKTLQQILQQLIELVKENEFLRAELAKKNESEKK